MGERSALAGSESADGAQSQGREVLDKCCGSRFRVFYGAVINRSFIDAGFFPEEASGSQERERCFPGTVPCLLSGTQFLPAIDPVQGRTPS